MKGKILLNGMKLINKVILNQINLIYDDQRYIFLSILEVREILVISLSIFRIIRK